MAPLKTLLPLLLLLTVRTGGQQFEGACPRVSGASNVDTNRFPGLWFHHATRGVPQYLRCSYEYQLHIGNGRIQFFYQAVRKSDGQNVTREALAEPIRSSRTLRRNSFLISFNNGVPRRFVITHTDNDKYFVLFHCRSIGQGRNKQILLVITRERNPDEEVSQLAIGNAELIQDGANLTKIDQMKCPEAVQPCLTNTSQGTYERC